MNMNDCANVGSKRAANTGPTTTTQVSTSIDTALAKTNSMLRSRESTYGRVSTTR